tara:strand:+ start:467 stop:2929 length:2463 start_codon:yes stop_codon:yes gene_type:complete
MGVLNDNIRMGASAASAYEIKKSCRFDFDSSTYMERTVSSASNRRTNTISVWLKRSQLGNKSGDDAQTIYGAGGGGGGSSSTSLYILTDGRIGLLTMIGSVHGHLVTTAVFRDPAQWYHVVVVFDTENGTSGDRMRLYVNGVRITAFGTETYPSQNQDTYLHYTDKHGLGANRIWADQSQIYNYYGGYMAELHVVDGSALTPSSFGETNETTGQWIPIEYTGSHGTNGFYMDFSNASSLGDDAAGSNDYTESGFATNDSFKDTPTNNFPVLNPLNNDPYDSNSYTPATISNGNLQFTSNTTSLSNYAESSIYFPTSGKWYVEVTASNVNIASSGYAEINIAGYYLWWYYSSPYYQLTTDGGAQTIGAISNNDVIQVAYDVGSGKIWYGKNNTWYLSGNPSDGTAMSPAQSASNTDGSVKLHLKGRSGSAANILHVNFGQQDFTHTPPTGFKALCTKNLPEPTITKGTDHFGTLLYTGSASAQVVNGLDFTPDLWVNKYREGNSHVLWIDRVRGFNAQTQMLTSIYTSPEGGERGDLYGYLISAAGGFQHQPGSSSGNEYAQMNSSGAKFLTWCWLADGTSGSSNDDGDITSTVSANTSAGFSIVKYTGTGTDSDTVGHGLGVAPQLIIIKRRDDGSGNTNWRVWHTGIPANTHLELNSTSGQQTSPAGIFDSSTPPTSTVFRPNDHVSVNASGGTYVAYCWSEVAGYSSFGTYAGNGSTDGPFIYTGFKPAWLCVKHYNSSGSEQWQVFDNVRDTDNVNVTSTTLGSNQQEGVDTGGDKIVDFLSNGFKFKGGDGVLNDGSLNYIYWAFAETPFKYANAE